MVKEGTRWEGNNGDKFHVIHAIELDGHKWVHYIKENAQEQDLNREYSCYEESFLQRFRQLPE